MRKFASAGIGIWALTSVLLGITPAQAQTSGSAGPSALSDPNHVELSDAQADMEAGDSQPDASNTNNANASDDELDPTEVEDESYFFLGMMYRQLIIPDALQRIFVEEGATFSQPGFGAEFTYRRDNFSIGANIWWQGAHHEGFYRGAGDPVTDTEFIDSDLDFLFLSASFLWTLPVNEWFAVELGLDVGLGFVLGQLTRTEATQSAGTGEWATCDGPTGGGRGFCETRAREPCYANNGGHYGCVEPNWFTENGNTPFIVPWLALPRIAMRFKPIRHLQIRLDGGYVVYGFFFGATAAYGF